MKKSQCFQICPSSLFCAGYVIFERNSGSVSILSNTKSVEISNLGKCQAMTNLSKIPSNTPFIIILSPLIENNISDFKFYWQWLWRLQSSGMWHSATGKCWLIFLITSTQINCVTYQKTVFFKIIILPQLH